MASPNALPGFDRLIPNVKLYRPSTENGHHEPHSKLAEQTIVICAWFKAMPKHIAKYTKAHQERNPNAQILLIESGAMDMLFTSYAEQQRRMQPALDVLKAARADGHKILLHVFSNGGCNNATRLAEAWRKKHDTPLPIDAIAFDSCPGSGSLRLAGQAVVLSFPKSQRILAMILTWVVIIPIYTVPMILGATNLVEMIRARLNDINLIAKDVPRVYLYSVADQMVPSRFIEDHCAAAWEAGYDAKLVRFQRSPHVAHVNENSGRYWAAIDAVQAGS